MRTTKEIWRRIAALQNAIDKKCDCTTRGKKHELECAAGGMLLQAVIDNLKWVLGHDDVLGDQIEAWFLQEYGIR